MTDDRLTYRGIDPKLHQWLKVEAARRKVTVGELLNIAITLLKSPRK